ncbi:MAG: type II CAAX endopeptidase family protein [Anaerovoracaceae bacterium]
MLEKQNLNVRSLFSSDEMAFGKWRWWIIPICFVLSVVFTMFFTQLLGQSVFRSISQVLGYFVAALVSVGIFSLIKRQSCFDGFSFLGQKPVFYNIFMGIVTGVLIIYTTRGVEFILKNNDTGTNSLIEMKYGSDMANTLVLTFLITVLAPFAEEMFFRAILFRSLRDSLGTLAKKSKKLAMFAEVLAFALAASIFISAHMTEKSTIFTALLYVPMACLFLLVYRYTGSLLAAITAHAVNNSNAMTTSILDINKNPAYDNVSVGYIGASILGGFIAIAVGYLLGKLFDKKTYN